MQSSATLPRDPEQDPRTRRFMQQLQTIINSLIAREELEQTGPGEWTLLGSENVILSQRVFAIKGSYGMLGG